MQRIIRKCCSRRTYKVKSTLVGFEMLFYRLSIRHFTPFWKLGVKEASHQIFPSRTVHQRFQKNIVIFLSRLHPKFFLALLGRHPISPQSSIYCCKRDTQIVTTQVHHLHVCRIAQYLWHPLTKKTFIYYVPMA